MIRRVYILAALVVAGFIAFNVILPGSRDQHVAARGPASALTHPAHALANNNNNAFDMAGGIPGERVSHPDPFADMAGSSQDAVWTSQGGDIPHASSSSGVAMPFGDTGVPAASSSRPSPTSEISAILAGLQEGLRASHASQPSGQAGTQPGTQPGSQIESQTGSHIGSQVGSQTGGQSLAGGQADVPAMGAGDMRSWEPVGRPAGGPVTAAALSATPLQNPSSWGTLLGQLAVPQELLSSVPSLSSSLPASTGSATHPTPQQGRQVSSRLPSISVPSSMASAAAQFTPTTSAGPSARTSGARAGARTGREQPGPGGLLAEDHAGRHPAGRTNAAVASRAGVPAGGPEVSTRHGDRAAPLAHARHVGTPFVGATASTRASTSGGPASGRPIPSSLSPGSSSFSPSSWSSLSLRSSSSEHPALSSRLDLVAPCGGAPEDLLPFNLSRSPFVRAPSVRAMLARRHRHLLLHAWQGGDEPPGISVGGYSHWLERARVETGGIRQLAGGEEEYVSRDGERGAVGGGGMGESGPDGLEDDIDEDADEDEEEDDNDSGMGGWGQAHEGWLHDSLGNVTMMPRGMAIDGAITEADGTVQAWDSPIPRGWDQHGMRGQKRRMQARVWQQRAGLEGRQWQQRGGEEGQEWQQRGGEEVPEGSRQGQEWNERSAPRRSLLASFSWMRVGCDHRETAKVVHENAGSGPRAKPRPAPHEKPLIDCLNNIRRCDRRAAQIAAELPSIKLFDDTRDVFGITLPPRIRSCALVGNAGHLVEAMHGPFIDRHDVVVRFNMLPVDGFQERVGSKTSYRLVNHRRSGQGCCDGKWAEAARGEPTGMIMWFQWGRGSISAACRKRYPNNELVYMPAELIESEVEMMRLLRKDMMRLGVGSFGTWKQLTSGAKAILLFTRLCDSVSLYGFTTYKESKRDQYGPGVKVKARSGFKFHDWTGEKFVWRLLHAAGKVAICSMPIK